MDRIQRAMSEVERFDNPKIFVVGNSRSGTTMMMRILNNHSMVHCINESHFFEKYWSPKDEGAILSEAEARDLLARMYTRQRAGFFERVEKHGHKYATAIDELLKVLNGPPTRARLYHKFLEKETALAGKRIPCEKTPHNVYYLSEIFGYFPNIKVINMVRDPRAIMLSQKRKWKRRSLGADFMTKREVMRLRINYHPLAVSRLWKAAIGAGKKHSSDPRVHTVRFEDILEDAESTVRTICSFAEIPFEPKMLEVPHAGSSSEADKKSDLGIRKTRAKGWLEKGLTSTEIKICQTTCKALMQEYGYEMIPVKANLIELGWSYLIFPFKMALALAVNLNRIRGLADTLKRRLSR
jgi:hypothetical protein